MRVVIGATDVPSAGTRVQLSSDGSIDANDRVLWARFKSKPDNGGVALVGISDVSSSDGWTLSNDDDIGLTLDFRAYGGSVLASVFYFDAAANGYDVEWALILE